MNQKRGPKPTANRIFLEGIVAKILTKKNEVIVIDADDVELVRPFKWFVVRNPKNDNNFYACAANKKLHRLIMGTPPAGYIVDHKNRDTLDNRRENLRFCTVSENNQNRVHRNNGIDFVSSMKSRPWRVRIMANGKRHTVGHFAEHGEALSARFEAEKKILQDFAPKR